ncbi:DUF2157 domain-containing protein [Candidatus Woesearchaeota archaeon]|nr:DUF2157 domain-containing protein [Candidatus Woesearchaeota archaeon]
MLKNRKAASFGTIVAIFGSVLIALGIAWLIAQNWHQMPAPLKIFILLAATIGAYTAGTIFRIRGYHGIGKALLVLGALLYTLTIFLIAQIFSTSVSFQGTAWLLLLAWVGVFASAYIFDSSASLVVALAEFIVWLVMQYLAFIEAKDELISPGILAFYLLATGVLLYGLSLWHRSKNQKFAGVYQWWTAFYFLFFTYILSFQTLLPLIWPKEAISSTPSIIFLFFLALLSLAAFVSGILVSANKNIVENKETFGVIGIVGLLAVLIGLTSFVSNDRINLFSWLFGDSGGASTKLWALWTTINIVFILLILAVIFYGTWQRLPKLINLGIVFFALDIITRYMGFVMDLWGYTSLSVIFIIGGGILLVGGWFIERWRKNLVMRAKLSAKAK